MENFGQFKKRQVEGLLQEGNRVDAILNSGDKRQQNAIWSLMNNREKAEYYKKDQAADPHFHPRHRWE